MNTTVRPREEVREIQISEFLKIYWYLIIPMACFFVVITGSVSTRTTVASKYTQKTTSIGLSGLKTLKTALLCVWLCSISL